MHTTTSPRSSTPTSTRRYRWRVIDIVTASVVAVASGVVFWIWGIIWNPISAPVSAVMPGFQGILNGPWLFAGVLVALIVRKPGAAIYGELIAGTVEALIGNSWGFMNIVSGVIQGLGAEIVFALFLYANWRLVPALIAGFGAGIGESVLDLLVSYPGSKPFFIIIYTVTTALSGLLVGGVGSWYLVRALARTGALSRFEAGREVTGRV